MKKFLEIMLVMLILVSAVAVTADDNRGKNDRNDQKKDDYRKDDRQDNDKSDKKGNPWNFFNKKNNDQDDHRDYNYRRNDNHRDNTVGVVIGGTSVVIIEQRGHFENMVVGYRTIGTREIYHPAVTSYVFNIFKFRFDEVFRPAWTETIELKEPIIQRVWVRDY